MGACSPDHTRVCLVLVNICFLVLLSESVVDLDCCVDLKNIQLACTVLYVVPIFIISHFKGLYKLFC